MKRHAAWILISSALLLGVGDDATLPMPTGRTIYLRGYAGEGLTTDTGKLINGGGYILVGAEAGLNAMRVYDPKSQVYLNVNFTDTSDAPFPALSAEKQAQLKNAKSGMACADSVEGVGPGAIRRAAEQYKGHANPVSELSSHSSAEAKSSESAPMTPDLASGADAARKMSVPNTPSKPLQSTAGTASDETPPPLHQQSFASSVLETQQTKAIENAVDIGERTRREGFVTSAVEILKQNEAEARHDTHAINQEYVNAPLPLVEERLNRAQSALAVAAEEITRTPDLSTGEKSRFRAVLLNARDKTALGAKAIREAREGKDLLGYDSPFKNLISPASAGAALEAKASEAISQLFGYAPAANMNGKSIAPQAGAPSEIDAVNPTSNEALVDRTALFHGLEASERTKIETQLKLADKPRIPKQGRTLAGTTSDAPKTLTLLHNGYIFGGSSTGTDCSAFVSAALPVDVRKGRFTTLDFRTMWLYLSTGHFPKPPSYPADHRRRVIEAAQAFEPVNLYGGDTLETGDLLVQRFLWDTAGHVFIVRRYNPVTMKAEVIEASQSAGTIRQRSFSLTLAPPNAAERNIRPGMFGLRIRPEGDAACKASAAVTPPGRSKGAKT